LGHLPSTPEPGKRNEWDEYNKRLTLFRSEYVYNKLPVFEFYILRTAKSVTEYFVLMKTRIDELDKFILNAFAKGFD